MKLQAYRIKERKEVYFEIVEPLTLNDVEVAVMKPKFDGHRNVDGEIRLHLKPDAQAEVRKLASQDDRERIMELQDRFSPEEAERLVRDHYMGIIMGRYHGGLYHGRSPSLDFRGIRKEETRQKKIQAVIMELAGTFFMEQDSIVEKLLNNFNGMLENKIEGMNREYVSFIKNLYSGEHISEDWKKEHLDDAKVNAELEIVDAQLEELKAERESIVKKQVEARNRNMYLYLEGIEWGADSDSWDHDPIPDNLREEFVELYKDNKAFAKSDSTLLFGWLVCRDKLLRNHYDCV